MHGELWKVATENLRKANNEEKLGAEIVEKMLGDLSDVLHRRRRRQAYRDISAEGAVQTEDEGEDEDAPNAAPVPEPGDSEPPAGSSGPDTLSTPGTPAVSARSLSLSGEEAEALDRARSRSPRGGAPAPVLVPGILQQAASSSSSGSRPVQASPFGLNPVMLPRDEPENKRARMFAYEPQRSDADFEGVRDFETFHLESQEPDQESFAYYQEADRCFVVAKKKSDELPRNRIPPADWPKFQEAIRKEVR